MSRRRNILVTGSSGSLGQALVQTLKDTYDLVQLDLREPTDEQRAFGPVFVGSITDEAIVAQAMEGVDTVIHCAAIPYAHKPYRNVLETNVTGTFVMLEEAGRRPRVEQFIYISSIMWHGLSESSSALPHYLPINESHPSSALDYYACSKIQAEFWCEKYVQRFQKPVVVIRPPWIVSTAQMADFTARPAPDTPHLNDYIAVSDLVEGIRLAIDYHPQNGLDCFLFHADDQRSTTPSLELAKRYYSNVPVNRAKLEACDGFGAFVDCAHAREKLGWAPKFRCRRPFQQA